MKNLIILILLVSTNLFAQNIVEHVPPDYKYNIETNRFENFEPVLEYDYLLEVGNIFSCLLSEYILYCSENMDSSVYNQVVYWTGAQFDTIYSELTIEEIKSVIPEMADIRPVTVYYNKKPSLEGLNEWLDEFIKSYNQ